MIRARLAQFLLWYGHMLIRMAAAIAASGERHALAKLKHYGYRVAGTEPDNKRESDSETRSDGEPPTVSDNMKSNLYWPPTESDN